MAVSKYLLSEKLLNSWKDFYWVAYSGAAIAVSFTYFRYRHSQLLSNVPELSIKQIKTNLVNTKKNIYDHLKCGLAEFFTVFAATNLSQNYYKLDNIYYDNSKNLFLVLVGIHGGIIFSNAMALYFYNNILSFKEFYQCEKITNLASLNEEIQSRISEKKCSWLMHECATDKEISYIIQNCFYLELMFVFQCREMACEFLDGLKNLELKYIQLLVENPGEADRLQREFIINKKFG